MRALIQRVSKAEVTVKGRLVGSIGPGLLVFLGVTHSDTEKEVDFLVNKISNLRIFESEKSHFDRSLLEIKGEALVVSQFTLYGNCCKGRRPDFIEAAKPEQAQALYNKFVQKLRETGLKVEEGEFQAMMEVELKNSGPVTLMLESKKA